MTPFADLTQTQQVRILTRLGIEAGQSFGVDVETIRLVNYGFNASFKITSPQGDFALRLNVNSKRTIEEINGEAAWISALAEDGQVQVPIPRRHPDGGWIWTSTEQPLGRPLHGVLYTWVKGRHLTQNLSVKAARELGKTMAVLHRHAKKFEFPKNATRSCLHDALDGATWNLGDEEIFVDALTQANKVIAKFHQVPRIITHFDLHLGNVKFKDGRFSVFDFDDSVQSWPLIDAAQSLFYLRRAKNSDAVEDAFWRGLGETPESLGGTKEDLEALIAGRAVFLASELTAMVTPDIVAITPIYLEKTRKRLATWRETGVFDTRVG